MQVRAEVAWPRTASKPALTDFIGLCLAQDQQREVR